MRTVLRQTLAGDQTITINDVILQSNDVVRELGVLLDSELSMKQRVNRVASTCFYYLCCLTQIKRYITKMQ